MINVDNYHTVNRVAIENQFFIFQLFNSISTCNLHIYYTSEYSEAYIFSINHKAKIKKTLYDEQKRARSHDGKPEIECLCQCVYVDMCTEK